MKTPKTRQITFEASKSSGKVSALILIPDHAWSLLVLAHGAGAGMRHPFMEKVSGILADRGIATFRYQFPYMEKGTKRPDPQPILISTVRSAVEAASKVGDELPLFAGGKSMGGRMTSLAAAKGPLAGVLGIVFFGFPLHPAGSPSIERSHHLHDVTVPMLFLQGTRDHLADLQYLRPICSKLDAFARLEILEGADHSFNVPKKLGKSPEETLADLADRLLGWGKPLV